MHKRKFLFLFVFAIQQYLAGGSTVEQASELAVTAAASAISKEKQNILSRSLARLTSALKENTDELTVISFAIGSLSISVVAAVNALNLFFQTRSEVQQLRRELKSSEESRKTSEESLNAEIKAIEERHDAEIKAIEERRAADLQAERALRASEVSLARSEAVKEILLLGGKEYYAQILKQILLSQKDGCGD
jgi:hypothetical protein